MENIIRLNAVELVPHKVVNYIRKAVVPTATLREIPTTKNFITTPQGTIIQQKVYPSALPYWFELHNQAMFVTVVTGAWTGKIVEVAHTQRSQMTVLMAQTHLIVKSRLVKLLDCTKPSANLSLLKALVKTQLPAQIPAITTPLNNIKTRLKQKRDLRELPKYLRHWDISVRTC